MVSLQNLKTTVAATKRSDFNFDHQHMTTLDFGLNRPTLCQECVEGDKFRLSCQTFSRLAPLALPTIGKMDIESRAFFVRTRLLSDSYKNWVEGTFYHSGTENTLETPYIPTWNAFNVLEMFVLPIVWNSKVDNLFSAEIRPTYYLPLLATWTSGDLSDNAYSTEDMVGYDFQIQLSEWLPVLRGNTNQFGKYARFKFTPFGKHVYQILNLLGYPFDVYYSSDVYITSTSNQPYSDTTPRYNLYPLFSLFKIFQDYYMNPRYSPDKFEALFRGNNQFFGLQTGSGNSPLYTVNSGSEIIFRYNSPTSIYFLIKRLQEIQYVLVSPDIYNSSWLQPNINYARGSDEQSFTYYNPSDRSAVYGDSVATTIALGSQDSENVSGVSDVLLRSLRALSGWMRRNNVIGNRYVDRLLARYGVRPSDVVAGRCEYLGSDITTINVGDVTATANGTTSSGITSEVGDYNGKGVAFGNGFNLNFECDEAGYLIVLSTVRPKTQYFQGAEPSVLRGQATFDWWTPEFDAVGMVPLAPVTLKDNNTRFQISIADHERYMENTFGWLPTYFDYKFKHDKLTGDFSVPRLSSGIDSFHLMRKVSFQAVNNLAFQQFTDELRADYDRIFRDTSIEEDHFFVSFMFNFTMSRPMCSISDSLVIPEDGDKGKKVVTPPAGQRF